MNSFVISELVHILLFKFLEDFATNIVISRSGAMDHRILIALESIINHHKSIFWNLPMLDHH